MPEAVSPATTTYSTYEPLVVVGVVEGAVEEVAGTMMTPPERRRLGGVLGFMASSCAVLIPKCAAMPL